jgi:peptide/nickel transport system ATP-binding protein
MALSDQNTAVEPGSENLFEVRNLRKHFVDRAEGGIVSKLFGETKYLKAVDDVSFDIREGELLGLAGQSGCGKSTLGELLTGLQNPTSGRIGFKGEDMTEFDKEQMKEFRLSCQVIFQDPYEAMNPRFSVARSVSEPLVIHGIGDREERDARAMEAIEDAGLRPAGEYLDKLPGELSGGERQRVCIARAMVLDPDFLVADEPVSMLDVSVRTGILQLFKRLQQERDLSMLYISHDLSTINYLTDRTMIMYLGNLVEQGPTEQVIHDPAHPYTEALLDSVPNPDPRETREQSRLEGDVPDPVDLPQGCRFRPKCDYATEECAEAEPDLEPVGEAMDGRGARETACYHPVNVD